MSREERSSAPANADGEFAFTPRDFRTIADILSEEAGIALADAKAPLVYARLVKRLRSLGMRSFREYCALVGAQAGAEERNQMIAALTTNVTRFFREPHHFEHLRQAVLPDMLQHARKGGRARIWSAGCSTGEEPYSIALTILSLMPDAPQYDIKILATDIDPDVLKVARNGAYSQPAIAPIDEAIRNQFLFPDRRTEERNWVVNKDVRALVSFRELNLIAEWPMKGRFQAIFCRNVVIYFEEHTRETIWRQMGGMLSPGGHLYVGHSERIASPRTQFSVTGQTIYQMPHADLEAKGRV